MIIGAIQVWVWPGARGGLRCAQRRFTSAEKCRGLCHVTRALLAPPAHPAPPRTAGTPCTPGIGTAATPAVNTHYSQCSLLLPLVRRPCGELPLVKLPQIINRDPEACVGPAAATSRATPAKFGAPRYPRYYSQHAWCHPCCGRTAFAFTQEQYI